MEFRKQLSSSMNSKKKQYKEKYYKYKKELLNRLNTLYNNRNSCFIYNCVTNLKSVNNSSILNTNYSNDNDNIGKKLNTHNIKLSFVKNKSKRKSTKTSNNSSINHTLNKNISSDNRPKKPNMKYYYRNPTQASSYRRNINMQNNKKIMLKNILKIFGKELYNPMKSKHSDNTLKNHNIINNINLLNIINNNEIKFENMQIKRKKEKKSSCSLIK
jgi:hypothetical protein